MAEIEIAAVYIDAIAGEDAADWPIVINRDPSPDETGAPASSLIALDVIGSPADFIDVAETQVYVGGVLAYDGGGGGFQSGFDGPSSLASALGGGQGLRIVIEQTSAFDSLEVVVVRVVSDLVSTGSDIDESEQFTAEDTEPPVFVSAVATGQRVIRLEFNEDVQCPGVSLPTITPLSIPAVALVATAVDVDGVFANVLTDIEMTPGALYELDFGCIEDLSQNAALGSGVVAGFVPAQPEGRRFLLREMVPPKMLSRDVSGDLGLLLDCYQDVVDLLLASVDGIVDIHNPDLAPERFLDLLLCDLGNPYSFALDITAKRKLVEVLVDMYRQGGTAIGVENAIQFFVGIGAVVIPFNDLEEAAVLDVSELDENFVLGPSAQRDLYTFDVEVTVVLTEEQRSQILAIVAFMKPAHTHLHLLREDVPPTIWILGEAALGSTTVLTP